MTNAKGITIDTSKSPSVTFASLACGCVAACEPDGSAVIRWHVAGDPTDHMSASGYLVDLNDVLEAARADLLATITRKRLGFVRA